MHFKLIECHFTSVRIILSEHVIKQRVWTTSNIFFEVGSLDSLLPFWQICCALKCSFLCSNIFLARVKLYKKYKYYANILKLN